MLPSRSDHLLLSSNQKLSRVVGSVSGDLGLWSPGSQPMGGRRAQEHPGRSVVCGVRNGPAAGWGVPPAAAAVWGTEHSLAPGSLSGEGRSKLSGLKSQRCDLEGEVLGCFCRSIPGPRASSAPGVLRWCSLSTDRKMFRHTLGCSQHCCSVWHSTLLSSLRRLGGVAGLGSPPRAVPGTVPEQPGLPSYCFSKLKPEKGATF